MRKAELLMLVSFIKNRVDLHTFEVVTSSAIALALRLVGTALAFGFNLLLSRRLGAETTGVFYLALTVAVVASVIGRMGMDNTMLRFTASSSAAGEWGAVRGLYNKCISISVIASAAIALSVFLLAPWIGKVVFNKAGLEWPIRLMSLSIMPLAFFNLTAESLKGLKCIKESVLTQSVLLPAISLVFLIPVEKHFGLNGVILIYFVAAACAAATGWYFWRTSTLGDCTSFEHFDTSRIVKSSRPLFWVALMNLFMNWSSMFILGIWASNSDVGVFAIAFRTAMLTSFILVAVNSIAAPKYAVFYSKGEMKALRSIVKNSTRLMVLMALPVLLCFLFFSERIMGIFGEGFTQGSTVLMILAVGQFVNVAMGSVGYLLIISGNEKALGNCNTSAALLNLVLNLALIALYGIIGAALALSLTVVYKNVLAAWLVKRKLDIKAYAFS